MSSIFGGGGSTVNTVQNSDPWANQQPYLQFGFQRAEQNYGQGPYNYVGNQSPLTKQAQDLMTQRALDPNSATGRAVSTLSDTIGGKYLSPDSNPYLKASVQDALGLAGSTFAGQYGGAAGANLGNSGYQEGLARTLGNVATNAYSNAYSQERQNQLNALQLAPSLGNLDASQLAGVGAQQDALKQQQYNAPWENLTNYQRAISGQFGGTTSGQTPYFTNPLANAAGLGLAGAALYNSGIFGGGAAATGLLGTAGMSDLGWLALA